MASEESRAQIEFKSLGAHLDAASGKLDADGGLRLEAELVAREAAQQVGLANSGVSDEHDLEQVVVAARSASISAQAASTSHYGLFQGRDTAA